MKKPILRPNITALCLMGIVTLTVITTHAVTLNVRQPAQPKLKLQVTSPDIKAYSTIKQSQVAKGCGGDNISPEINWSKAPAGTKSFVLTAYDPDAPTGSGFWHWNVFNIPATTHKLERGISTQIDKLPTGAVQLKNDAGTIGYTGPCPPKGDKPHHYLFKVYALNTTLDLPADASPAILGFNLNQIALAVGELTGYYSY